MGLRHGIIFFFFAALSGGLFGQPINDECIGAIHLPIVEDYCSEFGAFNNFNATGSPVGTSTCALNQFSGEVWFTFIPTQPAVFIQVSGNVNGRGTLNNPGVFVYEGSCNSRTEVACNLVSSNSNIVELTITDLVIGAVYFIAVDGINNNFGTFQLCLDVFLPPPNPAGDCDRGVVLCDKSPFFIESLVGIGDPLINEVNGTCIAQEFASSWYKWTCDQPGSLTFTLTPNDYVPGFESDDLDFALYELPDGLDDCNNKVLLRCMAAGANTDEPFSAWEVCNGPTGLNTTATDVTEAPGCMNNNDNFVSAINMEAGKSYALIVNNFSQTGLGFSIEFGGSGTFLGPEPDFFVEAVQAFECDKTIVFTDLSESLTDSIVNWSWNFGAGANPIFQSGTGPHDVIYESFGEKLAALTVESARGCIVTRVLDLFVEPCCADTSTLDVIATAEDLICPGVPTGQILGAGMSGAPLYQFSLDGVDYQPSPFFGGLQFGAYTLYIQDEKGCRDSVDIEIFDADPFTVEAGDTIFLNLGDSAQINAVVDPPLNPQSVNWTNIESLSFPSDSLRPFAQPTQPLTAYAITVINEAGCVAVDTIYFLVNIVRPVYIPNVFSPNQDDVNDLFFVEGGGAVRIVNFLRVYNRWGGLVYERSNFPISDPDFGWDGRFNGELVEPGVFTYHIQIGFLDNVNLDYTGTITVVR